MYEALTASYNQSNKKINEAIKEELFSYVILDKNFNETENKGICKNVSYTYNSCYDYEVVRFTDVNDDKIYSACQFYIKLKSI